MLRLCVFKTETGKGFCRQMFLEPRAFNDKKIVPRVLQGISKTDLSTSVFGIDLKTPIIEAPSAAHGLEHVEAGRQCALASALSALWRTILLLLFVIDGCQYIEQEF